MEDLEESEIGIELQLDLDERDNVDLDDDYGNKNYGNVQQKDLVLISHIDSAIVESENKYAHTESNLERSVHNEIQQILEFNPDLRPPNIPLALKHAKARRVGKNTQLNENDSVKDSFCPCCGNQIENELLPMSIDREKLGFLGSGVPLFFEWMIFIMILCLILILCSIYSMIKNLEGTGCEVKNECTSTFLIFKFDLNRFMTANRKGEYVDHNQSKINFLATITLILVTIIYQSFFKSIDSRIESRFITPSHFTIMVEDIPAGATDSQIQKFFEEIIPNEKIQIVKVVQGYEISDLSKIKSLRQKLIKKENKLYGTEYQINDEIKEKRETLRNPQNEAQKKKKKKSKKKETTIQEDIEELIEIENEKIELRKKILRIDKSINEICKSYSTHLKNTGYAFISFKNEDNVQKITDHFPTTNIQRFISYLFCQNNKSFMGQFVKVSKAPEPGDILWENLVYSNKERFRRRIISIFYQAISIILSFVFIYLIKIFQNFIKEQTKGNVFVEYVSLLISVLTFVINTIISRIIKRLASYEKHPTYTQYLISVDKSLGIAQFINSILISVIVDHLENGKDLMTQGGVIISIQYNVLINTFMPLFNQFFNMWYFIRLSRRKKIVKEAEKCPLTQYEAHKIFEGTTFNADKNYSITIRLMLVNCFVAYICPNVIIWNILIIFADYWLEKYLLLRRHASPPAISGQLFFANINFFNDMYILVYSVLIQIFKNHYNQKQIGCCYWQYMIYDEVDDWTVVQLQFCLFYYIMPIKKIIALCSEISQNPNTHKTYKNVSQFFFNDYDRANPATQSQALQEWMQRMQTILKRERSPSDMNNASQSLLKNHSIMKAVPAKVIPQSESFPFFQYRSVQPVQNEPIMFQFLDFSPKKNIFLPDQIHSNNNVAASFINFQSILNHKLEESLQKNSHGITNLNEIKKQSSQKSQKYENNINSLNANGDAHHNRFLNQNIHLTNQDQHNKFSINLVQVQNNQNENESHRYGEQARPSIFQKQAHPIKDSGLEIDIQKSKDKPIQTDSLLLDLEKCN